MQPKVMQSTITIRILKNSSSGLPKLATVRLSTKAGSIDGKITVLCLRNLTAGLQTPQLSQTSVLYCAMIYVMLGFISLGLENGCKTTFAGEIQREIKSNIYGHSVD